MMTEVKTYPTCSLDKLTSTPSDDLKVLMIFSTSTAGKALKSYS